MSGLRSLVEQYGYAAVFVGALFEGETMLVLGGLFAHRGYLQLPWVMLTAFVGGVIGDQTFYWIGRRYGDRALARLKAPEPLVLRIKRLIQRSAPLAIIANRFLYGLRAIGPIMIATCGVEPARFAFFNAIGAALWAVIVVGGGYLFGDMVESLLGDLHRVEVLLFVAVFCVGIVVWFTLRRRRRSRP